MYLQKTCRDHIERSCVLMALSLGDFFPPLPLSLCRLVWRSSGVTVGCATGLECAEAGDVVHVLEKNRQPPTDKT